MTMLLLYYFSLLQVCKSSRKITFENAFSNDYSSKSSLFTSRFLKHGNIYLIDLCLCHLHRKSSIDIYGSSYSFVDIRKHFKRANILKWLKMTLILKRFLTLKFRWLFVERHPALTTLRKKITWSRRYRMFLTDSKFNDQRFSQIK